jgi:hypothetical protein
MNKPIKLRHGRMSIVLDPNETCSPVMVELKIKNKLFASSLHVAQDHGEVEDMQLTDAELGFLDRHGERAEKFFTDHYANDEE